MGSLVRSTPTDAITFNGTMQVETAILAVRASIDLGSMSSLVASRSTTSTGLESLSVAAFRHVQRRTSQSILAVSPTFCDAPVEGAGMHIGSVLYRLGIARVNGRASTDAEMARIGVVLAAGHDRLAKSIGTDAADRLRMQAATRGELCAPGSQPIDSLLVGVCDESTVSEDNQYIVKTIVVLRVTELDAMRGWMVVPEDARTPSGGGRH